MKVVTIHNENDYAQMIADDLGIRVQIHDGKELSDFCKLVTPIYSAISLTYDHVGHWTEENFLHPWILMETSYENKLYIDRCFRKMDAKHPDMLDEYGFLDTDGEYYENVEDSPLDCGTVAFSMKLTYGFRDLRLLLDEISAALKACGEGPVVIDMESRRFYWGEDDYGSIKIKIEDGIVSTEKQTIRIQGDEEYLHQKILVMGYEHFYDLSVREWRELLGIEFEFVLDDPSKDRSKYETDGKGIRMMAEYRFGGRHDFLPTKEDVLKWLSEYPMMMDILPEWALRDRNIILCYIRNKSKIPLPMHMNQSSHAMKCADTPEELASKTYYYEHAKSSVENDEWFAFHLYDEEIVRFLLHSNMDYIVSSNCRLYREDRLLEMIGKIPELTGILYLNLQDELKSNRKLSVHIKEKFELNESESYSVQAFCRCYELVEHSENFEAEMGAVFSCMSGRYETRTHVEPSKNMRKCFSMLNKNLQYQLAEDYPILVQCMDIRDVDEALADRIIKRCPMAGNILPDEYVIKNGLHVTDDDLEEDCFYCGRC